MTNAALKNEILNEIKSHDHSNVLTWSQCYNNTTKNQEMSWQKIKPLYGSEKGWNIFEGLLNF